ncbi:MULTISPECIES: hypothetical protein [Clostridium]|uniref:hypothetical protein n=1 Tax=Clostridium TaxID=1485 RepID=UPI0008246627|nr:MULTISPECIES: hypothetical protein [Clostridium]PJI07008.1 hypothetical protein CUB90_03625 [Clostridium sp. CT7]
MIFLLVIFFVGLILFEVPNMIENKYWRELMVFSALSIAAFILCLLYILDLPIPNPISGLEYVVKNILHLNYK